MPENSPHWNCATHQNQVLRKKNHTRLFTKSMATCSAVLVTAVKHGSAPQEWYWEVLQRSFKGSHRTVSTSDGLLQAESIKFADWGSNSLYFYRANLETQTKSTEHPFQKKIVPVSCCLLSLFQNLNLLRINAIYNSCQRKNSFPCWINMHQTHLAWSEVSMFMNHKTPRLHVLSQSFMDTTLEVRWSSSKR